MECVLYHKKCYSDLKMHQFALLVALLDASTKLLDVEPG